MYRPTGLKLGYGWLIRLLLVYSTVRAVFVVLFRKVSKGLPVMLALFLIILFTIWMIFDAMAKVVK